MEHQWFVEGSACCDSGCCWKNPPGNYPSPHADGANGTCCSGWPGDDFRPDETCCGVTTGSGIWRELDWDDNCNECSGSPTNPVKSLQDDCGNVLEVRCEGAPCTYRYRFYYNNSEFDTCNIPGGLNEINYQYTADFRRFYHLYHRNTARGGPPYQWRFMEYDCINNCTVPGSKKCCQDNEEPKGGDFYFQCPMPLDPCPWQ